MSMFKVGECYTREAVAEEIGLPQDRRKGGAWATGYSRWGHEVFIFCNVGTAGRTGHDYPNRWGGKVLEWSGKTGSKLSQPLIKAMISGDVAVHLFWRGQDRSPFTYAGRALPIAVRDTVPVEVSWTFEEVHICGKVESDLKSGEFQQTKRSEVFRRGPPPVVGTKERIMEDGPASVYIMRLSGAISSFLPKIPADHAVIKVGMSNAPLRRQVELNNGFPPGASVEWSLSACREYPSALAAFQAEGAVLEELRLRRYWIGGEFACVPIAEIPVL